MGDQVDWSFDAISHEWLLSHIPMDRAILRKWLKAGVMEQLVHHPTTIGTPQGGIISPALMNLTLDGMESLLKTAFPQRSGKLVNLARFADDFVITGKSKEILENEVKPLITAFLKERGLQLSESKTRITHINDGFDFLGTHIRKYKGRCLTKPSRPNVRAFLAEIKATFRENLHTPVEVLIRRLNSKIRGWALFHRSSASKETFNYVDHEIFCHLKRWMLRRHPGKRRSWCYRKYLTRIGSRGYVLESAYLDRQGKPHPIRLVNASDIPIKRHIKVKAAANLYDPTWEPYFVERLALQMKNSLQGYERLNKLWYNQNGRCSTCDEKISRETGWHLHHRKWLVNGGDDSFSNLSLMHPTCHQQLHAQTHRTNDPDCHTASAEAGV